MPTDYTMAHAQDRRTSFVIAHHLSTICDADVILVMNLPCNSQLVEALVEAS